MNNNLCSIEDYLILYAWVIPNRFFKVKNVFQFIQMEGHFTTMEQYDVCLSQDHIILIKSSVKWPIIS